MRFLTLSLALFLFLQGYCNEKQIHNLYGKAFTEAYHLHPEIPKGLLEAVSFTQTRLYHLTANEPVSCLGLPQSFTLFGMVEDGKGVFRNNLQTISSLSGYSALEIKTDPRTAILAYATALVTLNTETRGSAFFSADFPWLTRVSMLSELPAKKDFAFDSFLYEVVRFINNPEMAAEYGFKILGWDEEKIFGENLKVLSSRTIIAGEKDVKTPEGNVYKLSPELQSPDYPPALWNPAGSCNYSNGRSQAVSAVTIHTVQGSYAGCISWFQNCAASVSAHYVVRSSDGQITQMVLESNTAWHVGNQNSYTVGIEHEGYVTQPSWYTMAMYNASAALSADICASHGIDPLRTGWWPWLATTNYNTSSIPGACTRVKGHQHYPSQTHTDPGQYWDWDLYYKLINPAPAATMLTSASGIFFDTGGSGGNYTDDERVVWTIAPPNASSVTLTFSAFSVENTWDYLFIYDGNSVNSPLIGMYTGSNSPGTILSTGSSMTIEFRSDCSTNDAGWNATWNSSASAPPSNLTVQQSSCPSLGVTLNWSNTGNGWYADVSTDPNFTVYYNKNVSNTTSSACPGSFCEYPSCNTYLQFEPNTTYYWRIWDGISQTYGTPFTTPVCATTDNNCSGSIDDSGGPNGNYGSNEDYTFTISPPNAGSISINFSAFDLENGFDSLYIHDGPNVNAPLLGAWTGSISPGIVNSSGGNMTLHFVSDPLVNNTGFSAVWSCTQVTGTNDLPALFLNTYPNPIMPGEDLFIQTSVSGMADITLSDISGKIVLRYRMELNTGDNAMILPLLAGGSYVLDIHMNGSSRRFPVLIR
ncbi:MAG: N-acetylmuramoyl-L-alanine amidase [Bacteroidia bacterium]|nr:N-acetylmuramoyl-L-alanine amidase [Bacteroidia bacterium]